MPVWAKTRLFEPTPVIARLLLIGLGAFTTWAGSYPLSEPLVALAAGYVSWTALLLALPPFRQPLWLVGLTPVLDVGATTTFAALVGIEQFPVWILYVFPLAVAGAMGFMPALAASGLTLAGYGVLAGIAGQSGDPAAVWPIAALAAMAVTFAVLPSRWMAEWRKEQAWQALAAERETARRERILAHTAARLLTTFEPERVGQAAIDAVSDGLPVGAQLVPRTRAAEQATEDRNAEAEPSHGTVVPLGDTYLTVSPRANELNCDEMEWLRRLAGLAELALARCTQHLDLQAEERRLRAVWESLPAPAALWSPSGELLLANAAYRDLDLPMDVLSDEAEQELTTGEPPRTFVAMRGQLPDSSCWLALLREITRERQELAAKDEFLSLVGHELRTPLTSIHGFSQMIDRNLSVIKQQVGQLDRLINDLAAESSGKGGTLSLDLQPVDLTELVRGAAERCKASYPDRKVELDLSAVPPVKADPARLNQVIDNLLNNAMKYSPPEQPIRLRVEMRKGQVLLGVEDQGVGIDREHLPHLFDRFYRVPNAHTEQVKGLGLGLSIVRDLVAAHGGRVWAESQGPGRGSTFLVSLPCSSGEDAGAGPDQPRVSAPVRPERGWHAVQGSE